MTQSAQTTISSSRPWALRLFNFRQKKSYHRVLFRKHFLTFSKWNASQWKKNPKFILNHTRRSILVFFSNHLFNFFIFVYIKCLIVFADLYLHLLHCMQKCRFRPVIIQIGTWNKPATTVTNVSIIDGTIFPLDVFIAWNLVFCS